MSFVQYKYGGFMTEIKYLARKRISLKNKIRHHKLKIEEIEEKLKEVDSELDKYLKLAGN